jgi:hypothetical protein
MGRLSARSSNPLKSRHTSNPDLENLILFQRDKEMLKTHDIVLTKTFIAAFASTVLQVALLFVKITERHRT